MEDICTGCLSSGRKMHFIGETGFYQLYSQILNEIPVQDVSQICIRVCWECCALLQKFQLFKAKVKQSYLEHLWNIEPLFSSPSRLTTREVHNLSYPDEIQPMKDDVDVKSEFVVTTDIKTEDDDNVEHREPEAFVNDLLVERNAEEPEKKMKRKVKQKKPAKNKIRVKKKKKRKDKEVIEPEPIKSDVSDTDCVLEDGFQNENDESRTEENKEEDSDLRKLEVVVELKKVEELPKEVAKRSTRLSVVRVPKPPVELLPEKPQCVECGKMFSSKKTYRYHLNVLHKGNNRYPCPRCGKIYQWKSNLGRHMRTHKAVDAGELYCDMCDKSFASVATYRQHLRISRRHVSENEFSYTCNECGKKFVNKTRLRDHIDWEHLKKIKFRCQLCNKPFKCHTSLYVHLQNVHRNKEKKDNLCHVCGKSYQNAAKLKYHIIALHTGETPYQCSQCTAAFGWYSSLYRHIREVHYKVKTQPKKSKKSKKLDNEPPVYMNYHP